MKKKIKNLIKESYLLFIRAKNEYEKTKLDTSLAVMKILHKNIIDLLGLIDNKISRLDFDDIEEYILKNYNYNIEIKEN